MVVLGLPWVLTIFKQKSSYYYLVFDVFNALQGFTLLTFYCALSVEVSETITTRAYALALW